VLLAIDVGNTQTHLGAFDGERLVEHWRFQTRSGATGDELAERIAGLFRLCEMGLGDLRSVCVSSVVPPLGAQYERMTARYLESDFLAIEPGVKTGMPIRIDNPLEVGADRLVNSIAAFERFKRASVVVDFGTGINIDAVSEAGEYLGGAIGPGLEISLTALVERAARIRRIDPEGPETAIRRSSRARLDIMMIDEPARMKPPANSVGMSYDSAENQIMLPTPASEPKISEISTPASPRATAIRIPAMIKG